MARRASAKPAQWQLPAALACLGLVAVLIFLSSAAHGHGLAGSADSEHQRGLKRLGQSILKAQQSSSSQLVVLAGDDRAAAPTRKPAAAGDFRVQFDVVTEDGPGAFVVRVHEDWAPVGAARFRELVEAKYYDDVRFFRVIPTFMVQFGISGSPAFNSEWRAKPIKDDSVRQSNKPGYITFAKTGEPNSRTTQVFINYFDNAGLDGQGFAPFGVVEGDGMSVVKRIYNCGEKPSQGKIQSEGNAYLDREFPKLSRVVAARVLPDVPRAEATASPSPAPGPPPAGGEDRRGENSIEWKKHTGKSCQGYANGDSRERSLQESKTACLANEVCLAIECSHNSVLSCTLRGSNMAIDYAPADCYEMIERTPDGRILSTKVPDYYNSLLKEYPFQQVATQSGQQVNIILVRSHMNSKQKKLFEQHKDEILFLGISSMNDYPLSNDGVDWVGMFPGFLHMMRDPEKHFPSHVKYILMSQSDFSLPNYPWRDYSKPKPYDFTYSASDCDVGSDGKGWCGWSKNWSFVKDALKIMCNPPYNLKGVLVATKTKDGKKAYTIPPECKDKMTQTSYIPDQKKFFEYIENSRFVLLPQIHDASPRVSSQALALDVPILMNYHIMGGWKYVNDQTGEFFHDISDFRDALDRILKGSDTPNRYNPKKWVLSHYGDEASGKVLLKWVQENFADRVKLPKGTTRLQI